MNTQTERLDNHTARLTVEVEPERLEKAKQIVARKLAGRLNIPGFRKGKAPYKVIVSYVGEGALIEDAVEELGNQVYKEVLEQADFEPYGPGSLEDVKVESNPTFTFVVPLQPDIELNAYRTIRLDYEAPVVDDEEVNKAMNDLLQQEAVVEESTRPVAMGDRLTVDIDGRLIDEDDAAVPADETAVDAPSDEEAEDDHDHEDSDDHDHDHDEHHHLVDEKTIIHQHDATIALDDNDQPVPGFAAAILGALAGERRQFELTYPDDADEYQEMAGKRAKFDVTIKKVENVTLPALNDDFAARVTKDEEKPLTLLELRVRMRENLQTAAQERYDTEYSRRALDAMVEQATVRYPEAMISEQVQEFLTQFDRDLRQRGLTLEDYQKIYRKTTDDMAADYRPAAIKSIERGLVLRTVLETEQITLDDAQIEAEIDRIASRFGDLADEYRRILAQPQMLQNIRTDLLNTRVMERVAAIAKNEAPDIGAAPTATIPAQTADTPAVPSEEVPEANGESVTHESD